MGQRKGSVFMSADLSWQTLIKFKSGKFSLNKKAKKSSRLRKA